MIYPDYYCESVFLIPYNELKEKNITNLIFDLDNTLAPPHTKRPPAKITALFKKLKKMGFTICLLTNNTKKRMDIFNENLGLPGIANGLKPFGFGVRRAMKAMNAQPKETAVIGDQLLSDVWAGKNAKVTTILIKPISERDFFTVYLKRGLERRLLKAYLKKSGKGN